MVVVSLLGGLGNQLFQYAAGRAVALRHNTALMLDLTAFEVYALRSYKLHHFHIQEAFAYAGPVASVFGRPKNRCVRWLRRHLPYFWLRTIKERKPYQYDAGIFANGRNLLLEGFWQNEQYFREIAGLLRKELIVRTAPDKENTAMAMFIQSVNAVSVHVRRTDYVTDAQTARKHGSCGVEYYQAAIRELARSINNPHYFVFSDDPAWAQVNLSFLHPVTFVTHNPDDRDYEDLRLMTICRHHIIANSSFSWWGAWLGVNGQKIVIAPQRWVADVMCHTSGLVPDYWRRV